MRKFLISARKYLIGALVGAALVLGSQVFAAGLIGKEVQGEITVLFDGTELSTTGVVIDGVSYLPLRAISTVLGLGIDYADGVAALTSPQKEAAESMSQLKDEIKDEIMREQEIKELREELEKLEKGLQVMNGLIANEEEKLATETNPTVIETIRKSMNGMVTVVQQNEARIAEIKQQLAELEAE